MKKKSILFIFILIICLLITFTNIGKKKSNKTDKIDDEQLFLSFVNRCSFDQKGDWLYYFCLEGKKINDKSPDTINNYDKKSIYSYYYDAINVKYKELPGSYIPVLDSNGNVIDEVKPSIPSLSLTDNYREKLNKINDYFAKKKFISKIDIDDLNDLKDIDFDTKNTILKMFNDAYDSLPITEGKYVNLPFVDCLQSDIHNGEIIQLSYFGASGTILFVNIDILKDGNYLSDLIKKDNSYENERYKNLKKIEKRIVDEQTFDIEKFPEYDNSLLELKKVLDLKIK